MADFFGNNRRGGGQFGRDSEYDNNTRGNNFDRRYTGRNSGYFDNNDGRSRVSRTTDERLNRTLPPIADPYQSAQYSAPQPQYDAPQYAKPISEPVNVQSVNIGNVGIHQPKNFKDVQDLIDRLVKHDPAIVDFQGLSEDDGQRILDFLSGAIYALGGSMQRISGTIFLLTPTGVSISATGDIAQSIEERRNKR